MFLFCVPVPAPDRGRRRTVVVFVVAAFDVFAAAAVAAVFVGVYMFAVVCLSSFSSGDLIVTVTALESGRSPHGGGQRHVAVLSSTTRRIESWAERLLVTARLGTHPGVLCIVAAPELYVMLYNYMLS